MLLGGCAEALQRACGDAQDPGAVIESGRVEEPEQFQRVHLDFLSRLGCEQNAKAGLDLTKALFGRRMRSLRISASRASEKLERLSQFENCATSSAVSLVKHSVRSLDGMESMRAVFSTISWISDEKLDARVRWLFVRTS